MNSLSGSATTAFNLLSIGQRGVGKTVFIAGSYAELHSDSQKNSAQKLWFDCQDSQDQENLEKILSYVARKGQYPPATMKITNLNFSLKRHTRRGAQTLCHFRWWEIPGEYCNTRNPDFQQIVLNSHGCCVFIDANALVHNQAYLEVLDDIVKQVAAIASLVDQYSLKYPFALIFTKYDLLGPSPLSLLQIEENLQPLIVRLEATRANYQRFYSAIPLVFAEGGTKLKATGAATSLLWLISELRSIHGSQSRQDLGSGLMQGLPKSTGKASSVKKVGGLNLLLPGHILLMTLVGISFIGVIASLLFAFGLFTRSPKQAQTPEERIREYEQVLQKDSRNLNALSSLASLRIELGQPNQAVPLMERIVQQEPKSLSWQVDLARLYQTTGQKHKAETLYDQILARQNKNLSALLGKALLRSEQGDTKTAKILFTQAEEVAPSNLKAEIRAIAQNNLP